MAELVLGYRFGFSAAEIGKSHSDTKFHLVKSQLLFVRHANDVVPSVCKQHEISVGVLFGIREDSSFVVEHISDINSDNLCEDCVGPMVDISEDTLSSNFEIG